ncbi:hypothetical protein CWC31_05155 [Pseudoalteromonas ruthenica]|uniref:hypothetical protein n=1 Tax=Pseudoalteromonas ruthenica TaxID=151081 RepID=UPI001109FCBC|nr:hypothetical protein [Pseudoalteromonas ruthenica]TLX51534.1 hypothetical protein CWC31_05155 [Pseudoalteromonas ruthenica]
MDYVNYHFEETLKLLVILSLPAEKQIEAFGFGNTEEEIAIDYEQHYKENELKFIEHGLITNEQASLLSKIDSFFEVRSNTDNDAFWSGIENHSDWGILRTMASNSLGALGKINLGVSVKITNEYSKITGGLVIQKIVVDLVENSA